MSGNSDIDALLDLINKAAIAAVAEYRKHGQEVPSLASITQHPLDAEQDIIGLKKTIRLLEGACEQLCSSLAPPCHTIMNRSNSLDTACLHSVAEIKVADALSEFTDGVHIDELAQIVDVEKGKLGRLLRYLATKNCFREVDADVWANNRLSVVLCSSAGNGTWANVRAQGFESKRAANVLPDVLTDPEYAFSYELSKSAFMYSVRDEGIAGGFFDWLEMHHDRRENFGVAMTAFANVLGCFTVTDVFPWQDVSTICDVGSGIGGPIMPLARKYPHLKITLQDRPELLGHASDFWAKNFPEAADEDRVDFTPIDFLTESPIIGQDIYYMRLIMHDWPDMEAAMILRNVRQAMAPHSRVLMEDALIRHLDSRSGQQEMSKYGIESAPLPMLPNFGSGIIRTYDQDILMLSLFNAKERTLEEFEVLAASADLKLTKVYDVGETFCLEFRVAG